jgi:hypothetical protein
MLEVAVGMLGGKIVSRGYLWEEEEVAWDKGTTRTAVKRCPNSICLIRFG